MVIKRLFQKDKIFALRQFHRAHAGQMIGHKLGIEQYKTARP